MNELQTTSDPWRLCLAPMMKRTDRHFRFLVRLISREVRLFTEMVTTGAILYGDSPRFLAYDVSEHPIVLQLGGSEPDALRACSEHAAAAGFDEINLNCGCPSDRVQSGAFGACLMADPQLVCELMSAMAEGAGKAEVSIKTRLGIDHLYSYSYFRDFVGKVAEAGCRIFYIHARKAWLTGLSPRENREIPPLNYDWVYRLKQDFPALRIIVNGGITSAHDLDGHLQHVDGVMIGRRAYDAPWDFVAMSKETHIQPRIARDEDRVLSEYSDYIEKELLAGTRLTEMTQHLVHLYAGRPGARSWRRHLSEKARLPGAGPEVVTSARQYVG